jgi:glycosyltransferase involved in cell wall biosynthesis
MELNRMGHEVSVIFPEHKRIKGENFKTHEIIFSNGKNQNYDLPFNFPCFTSHPRSNNTFYELDDAEIDAYINEFRHAIVKEVEEFKPDLIHAQHLWITPFVSSETGLKYVATVHGTDLKGFKKDKRYRAYALKGASLADKIITISKEVDRETKELYGIPNKKRIMIFNGYDGDVFKRIEIDKDEFLSHLGIQKRPEHIVSFAGKLTHFKGVDVLLRAAKVYEKSLDGKVLTLIAGNGELNSKLRQMSHDLDLQNVHFLGHVDHNLLSKIYNISDVNIVPSRNEPFGLVAIEALACGAPVVGTEQGGLLDIITDDVGELVPVEDDLSLAEAIVRELQNKKSPERREYVSSYARKTFSLTRSVEQIVAVYEEVLRERL